MKIIRIASDKKEPLALERPGLLERLGAWVSGRLRDLALQEDLLRALLVQAVERNPDNPSAVELSTDSNDAACLRSLKARGHLESSEAGLRLTPRGYREGLRLLRRHRLLERHLADSSGLAADEWHAVADRVEHGLDPVAIEALAHRLGHPRFDPHGDPIPLPDGELPEPRERPLFAFAPGSQVELVHVEDEPLETFREVVAAGLAPGERVELRDSHQDEGAWIALAGREVRLSPGAARQISARLVTGGSSVPTRPLSSLEPGEEGEILGLSPACRGLERRRLLDLGFVPGTRVRAELRPPAGDPTAYRVRGTLIALRGAQASCVRLKAPDGWRKPS